MTWPGYSGTPLPKKLGIKPGHQVAILHAPADFAGALAAPYRLKDRPQADI